MMKNEVTSEQASVLEKNKQVMQQFIRFINTGDRSIGETIIAPEVIFYAPTSPEPLHGFEGYMDVLRMMRGAMPDVPTKPAPEGTRALMAALGVKPDGGVLYVGDSNVDVETAHNAGLPCCGVLWGFRTREELTEAGAEYLAEDAAALEKVILG